MGFTVLIATVPTTFAVLEDAVRTSRKCQAVFVPGGGDLTVTGFAAAIAVVVAVALAGVLFVVAFAGVAGLTLVCANVVGTGAGFAAGDVGVVRTFAAFAPLAITGGVTVVRAMRSENDVAVGVAFAGGIVAGVGFLGAAFASVGVAVVAGFVVVVVVVVAGLVAVDGRDDETLMG